MPHRPKVRKSLILAPLYGSRLSGFYKIFYKIKKEKGRDRSHAFSCHTKICIHNRFELALFNYLTSFKLGSEKHKEGEYLQPAKKHIENKYDL